MIYNEYYLYRFYTSKQLESYATTFQSSSRKLTTIQGNENDFGEIEDYRLISLWSHKIIKTDKLLVSEMFNGKSIHAVQVSDQEGMELSLANLAEAKMNDFQSIDMRLQITGGAPLLDMVITNIKQALGGFQVPPLWYLENIQCIRSVSSSTLNSGHEVKEITIGSSSDTEVEEAIQFFNTKYKEDQDTFPSGVISFDVESIHISKENAKLMPSSADSYPRFPFVARKAKEGMSVERVPARLILGGQKWTLSVRADIIQTKISDGVEYLMSFSAIQPALSEFLAKLPVATGCAVKDNVTQMQNFIRRVGDPKFQFVNGFVETEALAVVAGFHSDESTMFNMNFQILGGLLTKLNSMADGLWSLPYQELPDAFKIYIIGDSRSGYNMYTVLLSALLLNMFPDPHIVCTLTGRSQYQFVEWFSQFIIGVTKGLEVSEVHYRKARSREDLVNSLRIREPEASSQEYDILADSADDDEAEDDLFFEAFGRRQNTVYKEGRLRPDPPQQAVKMSQIIPPWPSVVFGGARFLHSTRRFVFSQLDVLRDFDMVGVLNIWSDVVQTPDLLDYAVFGRELTSPTPGDGSDKPYLCADPGFMHPTVVLNPDTIMYTSIAKIAKIQNRLTRYVILEWLRLNEPSFAQTLLRRASEEGGETRKERFWFKNTSVLEEVRTMYLLVSGDEPVAQSLWAETRITKYLEKAKAAAVETRKRKAAELVEAEAREDALAGLSAMGPQFKRTKMAHLVPPVPSKKSDAQRERCRRRNQAKRAKKSALKAAKAADDPSFEVPNVMEDHEIVIRSSDESESESVVMLEDSQPPKCLISDELNARLGPSVIDAEERVVRMVSPPLSVISVSVAPVPSDLPLHKNEYVCDDVPANYEKIWAVSGRVMVTSEVQGSAPSQDPNHVSISSIVTAFNSVNPDFQK